jgi:iron complex outermembrane receptor protein
MFINSKLAKSVRLAIAFGAATATLFTSQTLLAQEENPAAAEADVEVVSITGSRIRAPGVESSSPIFSMDAKEIGYLQQPEFERVIRSLPSTIPADGGNVNNGSAGAATIDLRGLGPQRNLVLMDGKRMVPFNTDGEVDTAGIPTALIDRIDIVTGGASAVYGSDAIAGAVNVILKRDFQGVALDLNHAETGEGDGDTDNISITVGSNSDNGKGNAVLSMSWMERKPVLLGDRSLGLFGINSNSGSGLAEYRAGEPAILPPAGCGGPFVVDLQGSGSSTAIPTRFELIGTGVDGQFREDGTLGPVCSLFNFNPFNFYQTGATRYAATAMARYEVTDDAEVYTTFNYTNTTVDQQVAPSGTFGQAFDIPLANPFIGTQALQFMLDGANGAVTDGSLLDGGSWNDVNGNGLVDTADYLNVRLRRRTLELGPRTERFGADLWQITTGLRGTVFDEWSYDVSYQYGQSNRTTVRDGYTNLTNIQNALDSVDGVTCANGDGSCVPINLFGGFGTITDEMAGYARAVALQQQKYVQEIASASITGPVDFITMPTAASPLAVSFGYEHRQETGSLTPDECLKLAPASCQGGAGGNLLPISGGYKVDEFFFEGILPVFDGQSFAEKLDIEVGFRTSDYDTTGRTDSWKAGLNWRPVEPLMLRVMWQQANRAPNVGELASPVVSGLDNAVVDPCSRENAGSIDAALAALCISTGMTAAQVGVIPDIISGQINTFNGSDPNALPGPEEADTFTAGFVWTPEFDGIENVTFSLDYYDIDIKDIIGNFSAQEILDGCYQDANATECAKINRVGGDLTGSSAGVDQFTTNLNFLRAEGIEIGFNFGFDLDDMGSLSFSGNINKYLTQESQSSLNVPVIDCKGYVGTSCDPISDLRWIQRTTWEWNDVTVSLQWRHTSAVDVEPTEVDLRFAEFRSIGSYDYVDLFTSLQLTEYATVTFGVDNLFEKDPPVVGNDLGDTSSNNGNTFPSNYDALGSVYRLGLKFRF